MLEVDLNAGRYEIVQRVTESCAWYGEVRSIRIFIESTSTAVVEMSTMAQTEQLASKLGGRLVGATAFIELANLPRQHATDGAKLAFG